MDNHLLNRIDTNWQNNEQYLISQMENIVHNIPIRSYLSEIISDKNRVANLAKLSYYHENGFYKLVIYKGNNIKLRLHFWGDGNQRMGNIHNHTWDFSSYILNGGYINIQFEEDDNGDKYYEYNYFPREKKELYNMKYIRISRLIEAEKEIRLPNNAYLTLKEAKHQILPENNTITLVLHGKPQRSYTNVFSKKRYTDDTNFDSPSLLVDDYISILKQIINKIQND